MKSIANFRELLEEIFTSQQFASLATLRENAIQSCLVAFAATPDLKQMYLCTPRTTRKYANLKSNPTVSMLIHNCSNEAEDLKNAAAVSVTGQGFELSSSEKQEALEFFLEKHPYMREFAMAENTAIMRIAVSRYDIVTHFQDVTILDVQEPLGSQQ